MDLTSAPLNQRIHEFKFGGCVVFQHINVEHIHSVQHMVLTQEGAIVLPAAITGAPLQTPQNTPMHQLPRDWTVGISPLVAGVASAQET